MILKPLNLVVTRYEQLAFAVCASMHLFVAETNRHEFTNKNVDCIYIYKVILSKEFTKPLPYETYMVSSSL